MNKLSWLNLLIPVLKLFDGFGIKKLLFYLFYLSTVSVLLQFIVYIYIEIYIFIINNE